MNFDPLAYAALFLIGLMFACWLIEVLIWLFTPSYQIIRRFFK